MTEVKRGPRYPDVREVFYENLFRRNRDDNCYNINWCALKILNDFKEEYNEHCTIKQIPG